MSFDLAQTDKKTTRLLGRKVGALKTKLLQDSSVGLYLGFLEQHLQFDEVDVRRRRLLLNHILGSEMFLRERRSSSAHLLFDVALQIISPDKHNILCEWHEYESTKALTDAEFCFFLGAVKQIKSRESCRFFDISFERGSSRADLSVELRTRSLLQGTAS